MTRKVHATAHGVRAIGIVDRHIYDVPPAARWCCTYLAHRHRQQSPRRVILFVGDAAAARFANRHRVAFPPHSPPAAAANAIGAPPLTESA